MVTRVDGAFYMAGRLQRVTQRPGTVGLAQATVAEIRDLLADDLDEWVRIRLVMSRSTPENVWLACSASSTPATS